MAQKEVSTRMLTAEKLEGRVQLKCKCGEHISTIDKFHTHHAIVFYFSNFLT